MRARELARKAEIAELLLHAARELGQTGEPELVYRRFHELLADHIQHDGLVISSYDEEDDLIRCDYAWTDGAVLDASTFPALPLNREGGGMQSRVILSGRSELFNDVPERVEKVDGVYYNVGAEGNLEKIPDSGPSGTSAAMMVPVKHEQRVVGVVQLMTDSGEYTADDLELFEGLVAQMGAAVRNSRLQRERRRLEAAEAAARAVASEREQASRVLEAVGDGIFLLDADGVVQLWNRAAALATGLVADEVVHRPLTDFAPEWKALSASVPVADEGFAPRPVTLPITLGGRDLWLSLVAVRIADGVVYAFRDVTHERALEQERSDFVATISHELRTPMAGVYGAALTLLRTDVELPEAERERLLSMIASQAERLGQIVDEVLLASQLERGELTVEPAQVEVREVVEKAVATMRAHLPESIGIEVDVDGGVGAVSADADRVQQVLVNLIDNATKYGGPPVTVQAEDADGRVRISVSDSGAGIPLADRDRIFEKFHRAGSKATRRAPGTGLGLYISRELTARMGGRSTSSRGPAPARRSLSSCRPRRTTWRHISPRSSPRSPNRVFRASKGGHIACGTYLIRATPRRRKRHRPRDARQPGVRE